MINSPLCCKETDYLVLYLMSLPELMKAVTTALRLPRLTSEQGCFSECRSRIVRVLADDACSDDDRNTESAQMKRLLLQMRKL
jgi:hypothetical protein